MIAPPLLRSLVRFELTRRVRSRGLIMGVGLFVLAQAMVRVLTHLGHFNGSVGEFRSLYFLALIPVYGFGLLDDRAVSFDEALAANGVSPLQYVSAKLTAAALILAAFTVTCAVATVLVGGIPAVMVAWAAAHAILVAWLFAPAALVAESVSEIRMPVAVVYILVAVAMLVLYESGLFLSGAKLIGLFGRSGAQLGRLLLTDTLVATPALFLAAWLTVSRRLAPVGGSHRR